VVLQRVVFFIVPIQSSLTLLQIGYMVLVSVTFAVFEFLFLTSYTQ